MTVLVRLHGPLADKYGAEHRFDVRSAREAVHALIANFRGFRRDFLSFDRWAIHSDGDWLDGDMAPVLPVSRTLDFVPKIDGAFALGAALVGFLIPAIAGTIAAQIIGGILITGLLIGVSLLFMPKKPKKTTNDQKRQDNYAFSGPENNTVQGGPVPVIYGRVWAGSQVVSGALETTAYK